MLILCCCVSLPLYADDEHWYQIEIIVFENSGSDATSSEVWPDDPGTPSFDEAIELSPAEAVPDEPAGQPPGHDETPPDTAALPTTATEKPLADITTIMLLPDAGITESHDEEIPAAIPYRQLADPELKLSELKRKIAANNNYRLLTHFAWRQPVLPRGSAKAIAFHQVIVPTVIDKDQAIPDEPPMEAPPLDPALFETATEEVSEITDSEFIEGTIAVTQDRYLHLNLDLLYYLPAATHFSELDFDIRNNEPQLLRMTQRRRIHRGKLQYFDHPRFGVVAMITPFEFPQQQQAVEVIPLK